MNVPFPLIFICWVSILGLSSASSVLSSYNDDDDRVITIDEIGVDSIDCCVHGKCYCSNLPLALEHIQGNTKIKILFNILLQGVPQFKSTDSANVTIIGYSNPTIRCDKQGGLMGKNVGYIVIQGVTWDSCDQGIDIEDFISVHIIECNFKNVLSVNPALSLRGHGSVYINDSVFININSRGVFFTIDSNSVSAIPSITLNYSTFNNATFAIVIVTDTYSKLQYNLQPQVTISDCKFSKNNNYSVFCKGTDYVLPTLSILSSSFIGDLNCAIQAEKCIVTLYQNCSFINNSASAINISYSTINMIGPVLFYDNVINSVVDTISYGGAVSLFNSTMFVDKGPIKFYNNVADNGGAVYIAKNSSVYINMYDVEFYNNIARYYGGAVYIESSTCDNETLIPFYNYLFVYVHYAYSNIAGLSGNFMHLYTYDDSTCSSSEPSLYSIPYKKESLFTTQPCHVAFEQEGEVLGNLTDKTNVEFWLHDLHFDLIVTDCLNNLYGPVQVFICCDAYSCDERYEYIVDSSHNNVMMISNDTVVSCTISETHTIKLFTVVSDYNSSLTSISMQIAVKMLLSDNALRNCQKYIAYIQFFAIKDNTTQECEFLRCNLTFLPKGIDCFSDRYNSYFTVIPGYWYSNGFTKYVENCPQGHCDGRLNFFSIYDVNASYISSNEQCIGEWTGITYGDCGKDNYIIHDSTNCVNTCNFKEFHGWLVFFLVSLFYWIIIISLIFVLLHFKFDITAGYAYGIIFYYSILEQTVNASYDRTHNNLQDPIITTYLAVLSSIGNMKPPFQLLKLCFSKGTLMIDHMFLTYIHPVIVTSLIFTILILARNYVTVARTIGRFVNSKSICILLMLSYSSVSYTSVQLFRPLEVFTSSRYVNSYDPSDTYTYDIINWHSYLSPTQSYFHGHHKIYVIIAILCELIIGIGFPFMLLFQQYFARYFNINFTSIKPVLDQLKGCYREEYRWFAAYYLLCRQAVYAVDIYTSFADIKFPVMLILYALIMMVHVWFQPYKQRILNVLDSSILMTLILVYIGEHTSYGSTVILWILPLILFINCVTFSSRLKYLLIPISCLGISALSSYFTPFYILDPLNHSYEYTNPPDESIPFYSINFIIALISCIMFITFLIYVSKCICIKRYHQPAHRLQLVNEQNENYNENSDSDDAV